MAQDRRQMAKSRRHKLEDRRQMAEGRRHKLEDRRQMAEGRRQMAEDRRQMAEDRRQMAEDRRQMAEDRRQMAEDRRQMAEGRRQKSVLCSLASVVLAIITASCAVSEKTPSSNYVAEVSANGQNALIDPVRFVGCALHTNKEKVGDAHPTTSAELSADDEFDLLEDEPDEQIVEVADPLEPLNRLMFNVNDTLYFWVFKPCAQVCKAVVPEPARTGVRNFFQNLTTPVHYVNCLLQGKGDSADTELRRFLVNTTEGILGFGDPARDKYGLEPAEEDLGQTLAVHGLDNGFYIVWPIFGPSTLRDSAGMVGDIFLNPVRYVKPTETSIGISAVKVTNEGSFHIGEYEDFKASSLEPYIAMREAYIQYRDKQKQE